MLKSVLSKNKIRIKQTHSIERLMGLLVENAIELPSEFDPRKNLSEYAVDGRYAVIHDDIDDAERYIGMLKDLLTFIEKAVS